MVGEWMVVTGGTNLMFFFLVLPISPRYSEVPILKILLIREDLIGWVHMDFGSCEALGCFS